MARRNGKPGRTGVVIALVGLGILGLGIFIGAELTGLNAIGYGLFLAGFLIALFGVLREVTDRTGP